MWDRNRLSPPRWLPCCNRRRSRSRLSAQAPSFRAQWKTCNNCWILLNIPTFATVHGLGAVKQDSPYYLGMVGMHGTRAANMALDETDLLLVFGARLDDRVTGDPSRFAPHAKIVHFEIDPAQLDRVRPCELPVIGNLAETIPAFYREAERAHLPDFSAWRAVACGPERAEPRNPGPRASHKKLSAATVFADAKRRHDPRRRRPAPDVVGAVLSRVVAARIHHLGRPRSDGLRLARRHRRAVGKTRHTVLWSRATADSR